MSAYLYVCFYLLHLPKLDIFGCYCILVKVDKHLFADIEMYFFLLYTKNTPTWLVLNDNSYLYSFF